MTLCTNPLIIIIIIIIINVHKRGRGILRHAECRKLRMRKIQCGMKGKVRNESVECHRNEYLLNTGTRRKLETHKSMTHLRDM